MANPERKSFAEKAVELSKKVDTYTIVAGAGIFILSATAGAAIILGSVLTLLPAQAIERRMKKRKARKY